jgi:hypothetical protein
LDCGALLEGGIFLDVWITMQQLSLPDFEAARVGIFMRATLLVTFEVFVYGSCPTRAVQATGHHRCDS